MAAGGGHLLGWTANPAVEAPKIGGNAKEFRFFCAGIVQFAGQTLVASASSRPPFTGSGFYPVAWVL